MVVDRVEGLVLGLRRNEDSKVKLSHVDRFDALVNGQINVFGGNCDVGSVRDYTHHLVNEKTKDDYTSCYCASPSE